jgi:hypothetical protein
VPEWVAEARKGAKRDEIINKTTGYKAFSAGHAMATECIAGIVGRRDLASRKKMALE